MKPTLCDVCGVDHGFHICPAANRAAVATQRARYLAHQISHAEYYLWLADFVGITCPADLIEAAKKSTDEHLNDIPLRRWDACHHWVASLAGLKGLSWSQSDTVCTLKALARK